jgi:hypothetical protein
MDDVIRKQTCTLLLKPNSIFDLNQPNYKMQVACMNLIENEHASEIMKPRSIQIYVNQIMKCKWYI